MEDQYRDAEPPQSACGKDKFNSLIDPKMLPISETSPTKFKQALIGLVKVERIPSKTRREWRSLASGVEVDDDGTAPD
jgi:hypothetical protein